MSARSTSSAGGGDPGTAARIRDAAIERFGRDGFTAGVRAVAADAAVSPGLVVHYFGSKQGLRRACDGRVREVIVAEKRAAATDGTAAGLLAQLADIERFAPVVRYVVRSMREGGDLAAELFEHMVDDAARYLEAGVAAGVIRPSRDPVARARVMAYQGMGSMLMWLTMHPEHADPASFGKALRAYMEEVTVPMLEVFTEGLYTDRSLLEEYLLYVSDPPRDGAED
ncbi:TetR/AcrR family transcriptional regulator [Actinomadura livida]|uniref:AcrR family transcriptional regulator n=1 Tax=Actinomadura livida TaxID=79909 RepID=A0A7W7IF38_9ACTN|nr:MULTISPECIES: TetR family transcriptional regulator [Actinomadura]MBB4775959.1 AcrR family transcriptional regulator [Actinomadura catellatispora]